MIGYCTTCLPKRPPSTKPHGTLPKALDFNDIISVDLKELQPEYRKNGYRYILYIVDEFSKFMKGILIKDKEAETVVLAVYRHWVIGINGMGYGVPTQHMFSDNGTEFTSDISHSPYSNGLCERNHWTVDRQKNFKDTEGKVDLQRCLGRAIFAANNTPKESGFSSAHIVLGFHKNHTVFF